MRAGCGARKVGHRFLALAAAVLTAVLAARVTRSRADPAPRRVAAVALAATQAALGALTVVFGLPALAGSGTWSPPWRG